MRKRRLRALRNVSIVGILLASATLTLDHELPFADSPAGAATQSQCRTSQLRISIAPSYVNAHTKNLDVNITFANNGKSCELYREIPRVVAVIGTMHIPVGHDVVYNLPPVSPVLLKQDRKSVV